MKKVFLVTGMLVSAVFIFTMATGQETDRISQKLEKRAMRQSRFVPGLFDAWKHVGEVMIDSIQVDKPQQLLIFFLSSTVTHIPVRNPWIENLKSDIKNGLGRSFRNYRIQLQARGRLLEEYVPNYYRDSASLYDQNRLTTVDTGPALVTDMDRRNYAGGLTGNHIALWPSHGFFFDQQLDRWQWQRARLWQTVEDIFPWSFTSDYLVPMLENAGAVVLLPRERDTQIHEVIVDNDKKTGESQLLIMNGERHMGKADRPGFMIMDTLFLRTKSV